MFLEQQINILYLILKDHVTMKTGVMTLKIQLCSTGINYILKQKTFQIVIQSWLYYCIYVQINGALMSIRRFFQTHLKKNILISNSSQHEIEGYLL